MRLIRSDTVIDWASHLRDAAVQSEMETQSEDEVRGRELCEGFVWGNSSLFKWSYFLESVLQVLPLLVRFPFDRFFFLTLEIFVGSDLSDTSGELRLIR